MPAVPCRVCGVATKDKTRRCPAHAPAFTAYQREQEAQRHARQPYRTYQTPEHRAWRKAVMQRANGKCEWPGCSIPATAADHILPLSQGGRHEIQNGWALCKEHHRVKTLSDRRRR